jgi:hypothetical protein
MISDSFWNCLHALAAFLDGDRNASDETLRQLERQLQARRAEERDDDRRRITVVVAELSRLELRMKEHYGPPAGRSG